MSYGNEHDKRGKGDPNRDRSRVLVTTGDYVYQIWIKLDGMNYSTAILMMHEKKLTEDELNSMIKEATAVVNDVRIPNRRKEYADRKVRMTDPKSVNEGCFESDIAFFEAVLVDKFDFKKVLFSAIETTFDKTYLG